MNNKPMMKTHRPVRTAVALAALWCCCACSATQRRLVTDPGGATLLIERLNMKLETPCNLPAAMADDDVIRVSLEGYRGYEGPLQDIPQVAEGTYTLSLDK